MHRKVEILVIAQAVSMAVMTLHS